MKKLRDADALLNSGKELAARIAALSSASVYIVAAAFTGRRHGCRDGSGLGTPRTGDVTAEGEPLLRRFPLVQQWMYLSTICTITLLFIADVLLPRGATAAIGYCVVPVMALGTRRMGFLFGITCVCTLPTFDGAYKGKC